MEAYCVKCKTKREIQDPQAVFTSNGSPATRGTCSVCGSKLYRMGRTDAHNGLTPPPRTKKRTNKSGKLVIVESPAKARTVSRILGKGYTVKASVGHVRDLLRSQLSVDVKNNFQPKYRVPNEKRKVVKELTAAVGKAKEIYIATDPDREGEAIAWHLVEATGIDPDNSRRVVFHEITEPAVEEAFTHPREINMDLVNAQQARRVLDRLVGYNLSPLLWRKIRGRLSAGRVQSVALRLIVEREREIDAFNPEEYWTVAAEFLPDSGKDTFVARLIKINGDDPVLANEADVRPIVDDMETASYEISKLKRGERTRRPSAPFITSTLQQEASRRLGFTARRTMALAQQLYEGVDIGNGGNIGLITYMRTDSTNVSELAQKEARQYIKKRFGEQFVPKEIPTYTTRARGAQEAHEAIRPTSVVRLPESIKGHLSRDQYRLYRLIWQRFVASQMEAAIYDTIVVEVTGRSNSGEYLLRASGSNLRFQGYLAVYKEAVDEDKKADENGDTRIPPDLAQKQKLKLMRLIPEQHFTQPPPRYTEASLVRTLEENGIGRPSTYAPILSTIQQRGYVLRDNKRLYPTETGNLVNDLITEYFPNVVDINFTASMEEELDRIASGEQGWIETISNFYEPFSEQVSRADELIPEMKNELETIGRECPKCGSDLVIRWGRYGKFISCGDFPTCRYTEPWLEKIGVECPNDGGELVERKTRRGRVFYGCANYPECDFTSWKRPIATPCPVCNGLLVVVDKNNVECLKCGRTHLLEKVSQEGQTESA